MKKSELKKIIKEEYKKFTEEDAEKDIKEAEKIKNNLYSVYDLVENSVNLIDKKLSSFMAPSLKDAFLNGLKQGISRAKFNIKAAKNILSAWYK